MGQNENGSRLIRVVAILICFFCSAAQGQLSSDDIAHQYRFSFYPYYPIRGDLNGFNEFTYATNPDSYSGRYYFGFPQLELKINQWVRLNGGLRSIYTNNKEVSDTLELRPWFGATLNISNPWKWHLYNYVRFEYRDEVNLDDGTWLNSFRLRSRFGVGIPFAQRERAWKSKTWYGLADVEPQYRFDKRKIDPVRVRGGIGYIFTDRLQLEIIYGAQFVNGDTGGWQHTGNGLRMNLRYAFADGLL